MLNYKDSLKHSFTGSLLGEITNITESKHSSSMKKTLSMESKTEAYTNQLLPDLAF